MANEPQEWVPPAQTREDQKDQVPWSIHQHSAITSQQKPQHTVQRKASFSLCLGLRRVTGVLGTHEVGDLEGTRGCSPAFPPGPPGDRLQDFRRLPSGSFTGKFSAQQASLACSNGLPTHQGCRWGSPTPTLTSQLLPKPPQISAHVFGILTFTKLPPLLFSPSFVPHTREH